jgi:dTDP-4-dehydrorhamnose 3,5-epimerase
VTERKFTKGPIEGVVVAKLRKYVDERGWLCEIYRTDEMGRSITPAMAYTSISRPNVQRGPHEHVDQADYFVFQGPSNFLMVLWDNRPNSPTYNNMMRFVVGEDDAASVVVPKGVVHGYRNVGGKDGLVINLPDRLFMGENKRSPIDEIRWEDDPASPFHM